MVRRSSGVYQPNRGKGMAPATATDNDKGIAAKGYVHPEVLVSTEWLAQNLDNPKIRIIESDEDVLLYDLGHIKNAQKVDWHLDLNDDVVRDLSLIHISEPTRQAE